MGIWNKLFGGDSTAVAIAAQPMRANVPNAYSGPGSSKDAPASPYGVTHGMAVSSDHQWQSLAVSNKIASIKAYRVLYGASLEQAKEAVETYLTQGVLMFHKNTAAENTAQVPSEHEILCAVTDGRLLDAIKLYRERHPTASLVDAKNAVEGMRGRVPASVMPGSAAPKGVDFSAIDAWLKRGKILEAIKAYRDLYPVTLAEAKLAVEQRKSMLGV